MVVLAMSAIQRRRRVAWSLAMALAASVPASAVGAEEPPSDAGAAQQADGGMAPPGGPEASLHQPLPQDSGPNPGPDDGGTSDGQAPASAEIVPPKPLGTFEVPYPADAPKRAEPAVVEVMLTIDAQGAVSAVELKQGAGEPFDTAVLEGVKAFRFRPATIAGRPAEVMVPFTLTFVPPPRPAPEVGKPIAADALLEGVVVARGNREPVPNATVLLRDRAGERTTVTDAEGHFRFPVLSGEARVEITATGHRRFARVEKLEARQHLKVKYLVDRQSYNPYESVVIGTRDRTEISRTTLAGREIHHLPGTFGDPFKVVNTLPGVTSPLSLLTMPVVRGSSPGNTGIFLDGMRLPMLFHLFNGPSVIHPELIDRVDFYPGGFPVEYGGYTAGIVDGQTRRPRAGESRLDFDLSNGQVGGLVRHEIPSTSLSATVAARYGYPGLMMSLLTSDVSLNYWDYQARLDGGSAGSTWSVFFYGAQDELTAKVQSETPEGEPKDEMQTLMLQLFHRLDLRWRLGDAEKFANLRLVLGYDKTQFGPGASLSNSLVVTPKVSARVPLRWGLAAHAGLEVTVREETEKKTNPDDEVLGDAATQMQSLGRLLNVGAFLELPWKPIESLRVVPGLRADLYTLGETRQSSLDPRLTLRFKPSESFGLELKAMVGRYHQPPRLFLPLPGVEQSALDLGLLAATQAGAGFELALGPGVDLDVQGYFTHMDPVLFELSINPSLGDVQPTGPTDGSGSGELDPFERLFQRRAGRAWGVEVMLRKRDTRNVFGWLAYTFSQSLRSGDDGWAPFDFDRTHIFNAVVGLRLPRNWEFGVRMLLQSGTPLTTIHGYNAGRTPWQFRADLRIDKRAIWNRWMLDFYVDIINTTVDQETGGLVGSSGFRYVLPTVGFRAVL